MARERVFVLDENDGLRFRLESCVLALTGAVYELFLKSAGQSHGSVN